MIIGITGTIGAGKGTIVDYLVKRRGFAHFSARALIVEEIEKRGLPVSRDSMVAVANDMRRKHSPSWVAEQLFARAQALEGPAIIESLRTVGEVHKLQEQENFLLLAVDADQKTRFARVQQRKDAQSDDVTFVQFAAQEAREMKNVDPTKQNLAGCIALADHVLRNDGTIEDLHEQVEGVLRGR